MEVENSSDDFNRTQCSRSRSPSQSPPAENPSQSPPAENLSDTRPSRSRTRFRSRSRSRSRSPGVIYYGETSTSSDDGDDQVYGGGYDADDHACCRHGTSEEELKVFNEYFKQVRDSQGYEVNFYPGSCRYVRFVRCDLEEEFELLNDASRKCITDYNQKHNEEPDYELLDVVMATKRPCAGYYYHITFRARQVGLPDDDMVKTFRAEYYYCKFKGNFGQVHRCEPNDEYVERVRVARNEYEERVRRVQGKLNAAHV